MYGQFVRMYGPVVNSDVLSIIELCNLLCSLCDRVG